MWLTGVCWFVIFNQIQLEDMWQNANTSTYTRSIHRSDRTKKHGSKEVTRQWNVVCEFSQKKSLKSLTTLQCTDPTRLTFDCTKGTLRQNDMKVCNVKVCNLTFNFVLSADQRYKLVSQGRFPANTVKTFPIMTHIQTTDAVTGQKGKAWVLFPKYKMAK